jgi:opacity protein-like surface antigen
MKKLLVAIALLSLISLPALAQDVPMFEAYGGYQFSRHPGGEGYDSYLLHGFLAAGEVNVNSYFGIVGEFGYNRKSWDEYNDTESFITYLFGPRISYRAEQFRVFGHYLLGGSRYKDDYESDGANFTYTDNNYTQAVGGGIDIVINDMLSVRPAQLDLVSIRWSDEDGSEWENQFRYSGGVVVKF